MTAESLLATRTRFKVVGLTVALAFITYLDRVCISKLAPDIMRDLGLSKVRMGYVFSAFALAYAIFEIPTAWWADREGTRRVMTRIVIWWSAFTIATAAAFNYASLLLIRFLFGAGEAGAWPGVAKTFSRWIPFRERGRVQGVFFAGAHLGGGLTPLLVVALLPYLGWREIFILFGSTGFLWAMVWRRWFRDDPAEHAEVNRHELEIITAGRGTESAHTAGWAYWRSLLGHRGVWALCLMYFPNSFIYYFCITWLPTYLEEKGSFTPSMLGLLAGLPLLVSVFGDLFGGLTTDWAVARFGLRWGRCGVGAIAYAIAGAALFVAAAAHSASLSAAMITLGTAATMFTLGAAWSTAIETGGNHAGVVSAAMNTCGQIGSLLCPLIVAYSVEWYGSWNLPLYLMGGLFLAGVICWLVIDPRVPVFANDNEGNRQP